MKEYTAGRNEEGMRLSRFVENVTQGLPTSVLYKSFRNKRIKINGKHAAPDARLHTGDVVQLYLNDEFFPAEGDSSSRPRSAACAPASATHGGSAFSAPHFPPLQIVYEDDAIAVLNKPAHLLCHSDRTGDVSLVEQFCAYLAQKGAYAADEELTFTPALCNRLDRGTEGLVIAAKTYAALRDMNEVIRLDLVRKQYLCITAGVPPKGVHTAYLRHSEKNNKVEVRAVPAPGYKEIRTGVSIEERTGPYALCRIDLLTGRTHQIRAHLAFLEAPVLGDIKYGNRRLNEKTGFPTQALCAVSLSFGAIPAENTLSYLSGRVISLSEPALLQRFAALARSASL